MKTLAAASTILVIWVVACSGGDGAGRGPADAGRFPPPSGGDGVSSDAIARAACDWLARCGQPASDCTPKSPYQRRPLFIPALVQETVDCYQKLLSCDSDPCDHDILVRESQNATGARRTALDACSRDFSRCSFEGFECIGFADMTDAALVPFQQCLDETACADIHDCLTALGFPVQPAN